MARTRGSSNVIYDGDAVLTGKGGEPIPVSGAATWTGVSQQPNPDAVAEYHTSIDQSPPVNEFPEVWRCNTSTVQRNMDARDMFLLLDLILGVGSLAIELPAEDYRRLPADLAQHFWRVT